MMIIVLKIFDINNYISKINYYFIISSFILVAISAYKRFKFQAKYYFSQANDISDKTNEKMREISVEIDFG